MLSRALNMKTTVAFVGAGCSMSVGFPSWTDLAAEVIDQAEKMLDAAEKKDPGRRQEFKERIGKFRLALKNAANQPLSGDRLRFILGFCNRLMDWLHEHRPELKSWRTFREFLEIRFTRPVDPAAFGPAGLHERLWSLPIHRFITSNYDTVLEQFLAGKLGCSFADFKAQKALTQDVKYSKQLAQFAVGGTEGSRHMVFHCHGWCDDPDSMIVTEEDYQRWYLSDSSEAGPSFRQTMELLFGSHPILFVGFSLRDPDLLITLRTLSAVEPERKPHRQVFALLENKEAEGDDQMDQLYDQFGVHVIGYDVPEDDRARALAEELNAIKTRSETDRDGWLQKPRMRDLEEGRVEKSNIYWHYHFEGVDGGTPPHLREFTVSRPTAPAEAEVRSTDNRVDFSLVRNDVEIDALIEAINAPEKKPLLVMLIGPGGSGKSWFASKLIHTLANQPGSEQRLFFWSAYYAEGALTGIDRAKSFFLPDAGSEFPRLQVLKECLRGRNVLVFDGIERFLRPDRNDPRVGIAPNMGARSFLKSIAELVKNGAKESLQGSLVLTSRLLPIDLCSAEDQRFYEVTPMTADEAREHPALKGLAPEICSALVSSLAGHRYAFELAATVIGSLRPGQDAAAHRFIRVLSAVSPQRRAPEMIDQAIQRLDHRPVPDNDCYRRLIARLAVFMGPLDQSTFGYCYELANNGCLRAPDAPFPSRETARNALLDAKLLFEVTSSATPAGEPIYVMHPLVREFVFHRVHLAANHGLANFYLTGYTSGAGTVDPGPKGMKIIDEMFDDLRKRCYEEIWQQQKQPIAQEWSKSRTLCSEAFSVVRSRFLANTVPRWGSYDAYIHTLVRLADLLKEYCASYKASPARLFWTYCDPSHRTATDCIVKHTGAPLFGDELAWLYHELGLAFFEHGSIIDSLSTWEQAYEINKFLDEVTPGAQYLFQSCCNLGAACIQHGRLRTAHDYLIQALDISRHAGEPDHEPRIKGYLALILHLSGDLAAADEQYRHALAGLARLGNLRAESIFLRHRADLKLKMGDQDVAAKLIRSARAKAEEGDFPDLVGYVRSSEGHWFRVKKDYQNAIREYRAAMEIARKHGIRSLEADAHSEMARLALDLGDTQVARSRAIKSLQIANELHLGLRQTHGLVVLGTATVESGQRDLGIAYLKLAKDLAYRQQYWLRFREAEEHLYRLGHMEGFGERASNVLP